MAPRLNPALTGFSCLRCDACFPIDDYFEGCPSCAASGHASSLIAVYGSDGGSEPLLPLLDYPNLGDGNTPILSLPLAAEELELDGVWLKTEGSNPTGSHKDRMSPLVCGRAKMLGRPVAAASSGNAGVSLAAHAARAGVECLILTTEGIEGTWNEAMAGFGAEVRIMESSDARWASLRSLVLDEGYYPATNYLNPPVGSNPFGVQGYKTVGYEIAAWFGSTGPDVILVPCARGDLFWGIWEGVREVYERGALGNLPRMIAVEPFSRMERVLGGEDYRARFPQATDQYSTGGATVTWQSLHVARASGGTAVHVSDVLAHEAKAWFLGRGIGLERCSASSLQALRSCRQQGLIAAGERVLLMGTANGAYEK